MWFVGWAEALCAETQKPWKVVLNRLDTADTLSVCNGGDSGAWERSRLV